MIALTQKITGADINIYPYINIISFMQKISYVVAFIIILLSLCVKDK